jgi:prepilin signal peptidase PulO-like enzyme (type II secretory pathway)
VRTVPGDDGVLSLHCVGDEQNSTCPTRPATKFSAVLTLVWITLDSIEGGLGGTIELVGGLWVFLISLAALQTGSLPKALNYLGIVISVSTFVTIVPALELVGAVFGLGLIAWLGWLGAVVYRGNPKTANERI